MHVLDALDPIASAVVTAFVNGFWQGLVLLVLIGCLLRVLDARRGLNATTRYAVWSITLTALVALPVGAGLIAAMQPASPELVRVEPAFEPPAPALPLAVAPAETEVPVLDEPAVVVLDELLVVLAEPSDAAVVEPVLRPSRWHLTLPSSMGGWMPILFGAWVLVAFVLLVRVARGYVYLRRLKRQSILLPPSYQQRLDAWRRACGLRRAVRIAASETLAVPVAAGLRDPMILIPLALFDQLTEEEFEQVALHEWAHLQRWDDWTNLLQRLVEAVLFFHPAVLWVGRQMDREREMACDDWVVWQTHQPRSYATCLTRLVELNVHARALLVAPGMAASKERLFERVRRLLDQGRHVTAHLSKTGVLTIALVLVAAVLLLIRLAPIFTPPESSEEVSEPVPEVSEPEPLVRSVEPEALVIVEPTPDALGELQEAPSPVVHVTREGLIVGIDSIATVDTLRIGSVSPFLINSTRAFDPVHLGFGVSSAVQLIQFDSTTFQAFPPDTILVFQTLKQSRQHLLQSASLINRSHQTLQGFQGRLQQGNGALQQAHQALQVSAVRLHQSAATLNRLEPRLRRAGAKPQDLSVASWIRVLTSAARITTSGDKARLLVESAQRLPQNEEVYAAYIKTAQTVSASGDRTRALLALLTHHRLGKASMLKLLDAAKKITSGGDKTRLLIRAADRLPDDADVRAAYLDAAESIPSSGNYRRAMKALK